jgi:hypothetical protein
LEVFGFRLDLAATGPPVHRSAGDPGCSVTRAER